MQDFFDFCKKKGKEKGLDYLFCYGEKDNKNNVVKLYGKVGYSFNELIREKFIIPLNEKGVQYVREIKELSNQKGLENIIVKVKMIMRVS